MKKFLKDLEHELKKLKINEKEIREILEDHKEMLNEAINEGLSEEELASKFGNPKQLAKDLLEDSGKMNTNIDEYVKEGQFTSIKGYDLYKSFQSTELEEIYIKLISDDLEVYPYDGNQIEVHFRNITEPDKYEISLEKGVFELKRKKTVKVFSMKSQSRNIIVRYPKLKKLERYTIETISGDCTVKGIDSKSLKLKSISGDFEAQGVIADKSEFSTVSGDFKLEDMQLNNVLMSAVSGDFSAENIRVVEDIELNTVSGDFEFNSISGETASYRTVSGDLVAKEFYVESIDLKSVSGDIEISNEDKTRPITVGKKRTLSGDINIR